MNDSEAAEQTTLGTRAAADALRAEAGRFLGTPIQILGGDLS